MFTLWGDACRLCDGLSRRSFLRIGAFGGLTLTDLLRARTAAQSATRPAGSPAPCAKAAIMVYLQGGPSHLDTYDLKPDAPVEYRGEFRPIQTNVPGVRICELFPAQARLFDKLALLRAVTSVEEHSDSLVYTGYTQAVNRIARHPSFGAVVSRCRGHASGAMPPFVSLRDTRASQTGRTMLGNDAGYLGIAHRAFTLDGPGMDDLRLPSGVDAARVRQRRGLLECFDDARRAVDASGAMAGLDSLTARAFDLVTSGAIRRALDLNREDQRVRDRYRGVEQFLTARRLVEAGAGCVTLCIGSENDFGAWDTHGENFPALRRLLPELDRAIATLVQDLHDRGLYEDVVIVVWGEFGRTPRINRQAGRDHWAPVMSVLIAGGGLNMGQVIGASSRRGEYPAQRRCTVQQVLSALYRAVGIDPSMTFPDTSGRPMHILDDREPIGELL
jgi:hypothetical protein